MSAQPIVVLDGVTKIFGDYTAVANLSLSVTEGEIVAMVGKTGAGKSTAFNMIMGNMEPSAGEVRVAGFDPNREFDKLRGRIAVGFQTDRLLPWRTAVENIELGLDILHVPKAEARRRAREWLERVKLGDAGAKYPHELSGGMRQRVSLARALAIDPELILLDECFSQLDHVTSATLRADFSALIRQLGKTCLFITHRIDDAIEMADRIFVLGAPAKVILEVSPSDEERTDQNAHKALHERIAEAMGGESDDDTVH